MDATLSLGHPAAQPVRHAARRHRAVGRAQAAAHAGSGRRARAALLRPRGCRKACSRSAAMSISATTGSTAVDALARREAEDRALHRPAARRVPAGRLFPLAQCGAKPRARARQGHRHGRRHSAFRAHHGGRRALDRGAVRHRGRARADGRHALRRDRRSAVAPHRDARGRNAAARPARPRHRLASHLHAQHGQLLCLEAVAADGGGAGARGRESADQHRAAGPPRHLSEAARPDARAGDARARHQRGVRPRLRDGPVVLARVRRHARRRRTWRCMSGR